MHTRYHNILENVLNRKDLPKIYCDMDDVLVDFSGHVLDRWGKHINSFKEWKAEIPGIEKYWENIPQRPDAATLMRFIKRYDFKILTAYADWDIRSIAAKFHWMEKHFSVPKHKVLTVKRQDKREYAMHNGAPSVLIDDYSKNVIEWRSAGGIGIIHTSADTTIKELKKIGYT